MSRPLIYLAGPIFGCTEGEAKDWRKYVADKISPHGITGISPLRCEPIVGERYDVAYADPCFGDPKAIVAKNFYDMRKCDMTLAFFPHDKDAAETMDHAAHCVEQVTGAHTAEHVRRIAKRSPQRSIGTIGEVSWCYALRKPCVIVTDDPLIRSHPFTAVQPDWPLLDNLDDAIRLIIGIHGGYNGGKNL